MKSSAYEIAKSGGRHAGFLLGHATKSTGEVTRAIRSLRNQVEVHRDKIANPLKWVSPELPERQLSHLVNQYWPKEIANFTEQIEILEQILAEADP
ncbi:hypothetical protein THSYN_00100 [Candidatus Thiodictyon syntrophicum]|jgi:hypothetical protein|uniref:Uncharacterized protein n=2 Tax=Candidatus Thiodictyon syntrophicum TaxID=1166950 RepID=A0A2K8U1R2_9GAMM|nr:hypothetical protein THSYN_00100 [Candidatus Thiodictyon syntrophicum]